MKKLFLVVCLTTMGLCLSAQNIIIQQNNKPQQQTKVIERVVEKPVYIEKPKPKPSTPILIAGYLYISPDDFDRMGGETAKAIVNNLNKSNYCGYNDWRVPIYDEMVLMKTFADKLGLKDDVDYYLYTCKKCNLPRNCACSNCNAGDNIILCYSSGRLRLVRTKQ